MGRRWQRTQRAAQPGKDAFHSRAVANAKGGGISHRLCNPCCCKFEHDKKCLFQTVTSPLLSQAHEVLLREAFLNGLSNVDTPYVSRDNELGATFELLLYGTGGAASLLSMLTSQPCSV